MLTRCVTSWVGPFAALLLVGAVVHPAEQSSNAMENLHLTASQTELVWLEPILVTVRVESERMHGLPAVPGESKLGTLRFEIEPAVKPRPDAKPLPLEALGADTNAQSRDYDLFEWFVFPENGGTWSVRAIFEHKGATLRSKPVTLTVRRPADSDPDFQAMARIHHAPWSNYDLNKFCGDTFDLVEKWPGSRFAKYCHYWNGRFLQNQKEYNQAIASYRTVVEKYPDFSLADDADYGIVECLYAQKKLDEAQQYNTAVRQKYNDRTAKTGLEYGHGQTIVQRLAHGMTHRINRDLGLE